MCYDTLNHKKIATSSQGTQTTIPRCLQIVSNAAGSWPAFTASHYPLGYSQSLDHAFSAKGRLRGPFKHRAL